MHKHWCLLNFKKQRAAVNFPDLRQVLANSLPQVGQ